ncbi:putative oligopeptide ABC transporter (ATP binding protein) [Bradyrhizobium sp. STM 3843]|uniref:ABC transporter ATP-binding protein n=1 Tax=Bradyrhizobium sp. STM 3843 TaxID=551947 RepID=UPI000240551F|nr:oligopeptide/dipeptide ABC transporter ATP-binding protein [Bradyrhizobium sp. STM 3843]CCE08183.1 putative oligopeptide ABC transporter (ATP binding protein) [Bradyrhizobium sp. STM 3843]
MSAADQISSRVPLLDVQDLVQRYALPRESLFRAPGEVLALNGVSAQVMAGQSLGVVGESGSGKSTFARLVMALEQPTSGSVKLSGRDLNAMPADELRRARRDFQMVFQDPYGSLDPRQTIARIVAEPLTALGRLDRASLRERVGTVLRQVGLRDADMDKYPHEFSGGQRQRIAIARALITQPKLIVADEPVSALDVSVQAQVLNLLEDLQDEFGLSYILISHDLAVVDYLCDEVAVMYLGRVVEQGRPEDLFERCGHPYTRALLEAVPRAQAGAIRRRRAAPVNVSQSATTAGCAYAPRCPLADGHCREAAPALRAIGAQHLAACHKAEMVMAQPATVMGTGDAIVSDRL